MPENRSGVHGPHLDRTYGSASWGVQPGRAHHHLASTGAGAGFVEAFALPLDGAPTQLSCSQLPGYADAFACRQPTSAEAADTAKAEQQAALDNASYDA